MKKATYLLSLVMFMFLPVLSIGQCVPASVFVYQSGQTSTLVTVASMTTGGTYYIEYGLYGFTPGTAGVAGAGGTMVVVPTGQNTVTISGLIPNTTYQVYNRKNCSGIWSANSNARVFNTAYDCASAPVITCGSMIISNHALGYGAWWSDECNGMSGSGGDGSEKVFSFTPAVSGYHKLFVPANYSSADFLYKAASVACTSNVWTCIGSTNFTWANEPEQFVFGPLTAGVQYHIRADVENYTSQQTSAFRIECPYCAEPVNVTATNITTESASITWSGTYSIIEYGPPGFTPGAGLSPGTNGTVVSGWSGTTLNGLSASTYYDVYVRTNCSGSLVGPNSNRFTFVTASCLPITNYPGSGNVTLYFNPAYGSYNYNSCGTFYPMTGEEKILRFTAPSSGYFEMQVNTSAMQVYYTVTLGQNCNINTAVCQYMYGNQNGNDLYLIGPLTAGVAYDLFFDIYYDPQIPIFTSLQVQFNCPMPSAVSASDIQPNSVVLNWTCNSCQSNPYLEYGPVGFTPGTGNTPGTGGTLLSNVTAPYTLSGLQPFTKYDIYLRSACGAMFSANTSKLTVRTSVDCSISTILACSDYMTFTVPGFSGSGNEGSWASPVCGNNNNLSKETIWRFTPSQSGSYSLFCYNFTAGSTGYYYTANIYIKDATIGCNEMNWTCAGTLSSNLLTFTPSYVSIGNLTAGTTYLIMADGVQPTFTSGYNYYFRLECSNVCPRPLLSYATTTATTAAINGSCNSCSGTMHVEYGPAGFTPGTGNTAGAGGTLLSNVTLPVTLTGLTSGTTYDVYARNDCGSPNGFSQNSNKLTVTPCYTMPSAITSNVAGNTICSGQSITLTQVGGVLPPGGIFKWSSGTCGSVIVGSGNSVTVSPTVTTSYRVFIESPCGNSNCTGALVVTVNTTPASITAGGPVSFCDGGSVQLNANTGTGLTYQWLLNGVPITGATGTSYLATASGNFAVIVTGTNGCSNTSPVTQVVENPIPSVSFSGLASSYLNTSSPVTLTGSPAGGTFSGPGISGNTFDPSVAGTGGPYTITYTYTDGNGCTNTSSQQTSVTGCTAPPLQPGPIVTVGGAAFVCPGDSKTYTIDPVAGASSYNWTPPDGGVITSGQGTVSVSINYTSGFTVADTLHVVAINPCGTSPVRNLRIFENNPATPGTITGEAYGLCNVSGVPYSVPNVSGITYNWTFNSTNGTVATGQGTNSITANLTTSFTSMVLSVTASNACGTSIAKNITLRSKPATPGAITGPLSVCANQQGVPYSIAPLYGAATYTWTGPKKSHVSDGIVTSNSTTLVTASNNVSVNFGNSGGTLKVRGNNSCGSSAYTSVTITMNCREGLFEAPLQGLEVSVYPIPAQDEINIILSTSGDFETEIINSLGESLMKLRNQSKLDVTNLPAGMYFIRVISGEHIVTKKIILEK